MVRRWIPLITTTALLALGAVASAQDKHGSDHNDRSSSGKPSRSRAEHDRQSRDSSERRSSGSSSSRSDRGDTKSDSRTDRSGGSDRSSGGDRGSDRSNERYNPFSRSTGRDDRAGSPGVQDRRSDRPVGNPRGRAVVGGGGPSHDRGPSYWDGRGHAGAVHYGAPPVHNSLSVLISNGGAYRGTEVAVGAQIGGLRVGFVSYSSPRYYRGGYGGGYGYGFSYPFYAYDPYVGGAVVVASPWYRYSYLPPYLDRSHVIIVDSYPSWNWDGWRTYDYADDRGSQVVRDTVDDLRDAFEEGSGRIADRLVPEEGDVAIFNDGKYDYSLNPDDFQKMFLDGVEQSKTVRYEILEVRTRGDEIRVRARHEYTDSWGETQSVIHRITLRRENGGDYVVREFGSE